MAARVAALVLLGAAGFAWHWPGGSGAAERAAERAAVTAATLQYAAHEHTPANPGLLPEVRQGALPPTVPLRRNGAGAERGSAAPSPGKPGESPTGQGGGDRAAGRSAGAAAQAAPAGAAAARGGSRSPAAAGEAYSWPVLAPISSPFGPRDGSLHTGIDLAADFGTLIRAARDGLVNTSEWLGGYGLAVVVGHDDGSMTLYGHASELLVEAGDLVERGQVIARVGSTGNSTGPHLHFEVIVDGRPVNPLRYLPSR